MVLEGGFVLDGWDELLGRDETYQDAGEDCSEAKKRCQTRLEEAPLPVKENGLNIDGLNGERRVEERRRRSNGGTQHVILQLLGIPSCTTQDYHWLGFTMLQSLDSSKEHPFE